MTPDSRDATPDDPRGGPCPTCQTGSRETVGMVCQTCGTDYGANVGELSPAEAETLMALVARFALTPPTTVVEEKFRRINDPLPRWARATRRVTEWTEWQPIEPLPSPESVGAPGQDTGSAWVTRSVDCPEAPAQAHLPATPEPEATEVEEGWALSLHEGLCPRCREHKFIGHGPLCPDCYEHGPTPARDEALRDRVAKVLWKHDWRWAVRESRTGEGVRIACTATGCEWHADRDDVKDVWAAHRAHQADELLGVLADSRAEAWDEGYRDGVNDERTSQDWTDGCVTPNRANPYRNGDRDG